MKRMWMALMLVPALAWAQQGWLFLGEGPAGKFYGREDSLVRPKVGNPVYWVYMDHRVPRGGAMSVRFAFEVDCERKWVRAATWTAYAGEKGSGAAVGTADSVAAWEPVAPNSMMSGIAYRACS